MPTVNPRVNVTLSPSLHTIVAQLAKHQRVSKSTVLREFLMAVEPTLQQAVALLDAADRVTSSARVDFARDMEKGLAETRKQLDVALQKAAGLTRDLVAEGEAIRGRKPARKQSALVAPASAPARRVVRKNAAATRQDPPTSNRGVKS